MFQDSQNLILYAPGIAVMVATRQMDISVTEVRSQPEFVYSSFLQASC